MSTADAAAGLTPAVSGEDGTTGADRVTDRRDEAPTPASVEDADPAPLRPAPVEDADLALISPYHEDPAGAASEHPTPGTARETTAPAAAQDTEPGTVRPPAVSPEPEAQAGQAGRAQAQVLAEAPAPEEPQVLLGALPLTGAHGPAEAPAQGAEPAPLREPRPAPAGTHGPAETPAREAEPGPAGALAVPTDLPGPAEEEAVLRVAATPDVASPVPVAPLRLPPSYPPVHRPEPLPLPTRAGAANLVEREPRRWGGTVLVVLVVVLVSALLKTFVVQTFEIPSASMEDTLMTGDRVAVSVWDTGDVERGDIVVFTDPDHWLDVTEPTGARALVKDALTLIHLLPEDSGHHLIKRVIGTPGDRVVSDGHGSLTVNGAAVEETYLRSSEPPSEIPFDVTVPEGYLWVMGDSRSNSADSRYHRTDSHEGFVPVEDVVGIARDVIWPVTRWSEVDGGTEVFSRVPAPTGQAPSLPTPAAEDGA